jgi:hypothetical protein
VGGHVEKAFSRRDEGGFAGRVHVVGGEAGLRVERADDSQSED